MPFGNMTLYSIWELANFISGRSPGGQSITPERFNILLPQVQGEYYFDRIKAQDYDALQPFSVTMGDDSMPMTFSGGTAPLPSDYYAGGSGYYMLGADPRRVNFVGDRTYDYLLTHPTETPSLSHPVGNIQSNRVRMSPAGVNHIRFTYLRRASDPFMDYCTDADNPSRIIYMPPGSTVSPVPQGSSYNLVDSTGAVIEAGVESRTGDSQYTSATQELEWPESVQWKLLYLLLLKVGVSLAEGEAEKLSQMMLAQ